jgi:hypothetical protein
MTNEEKNSQIFFENFKGAKHMKLLKVGNEFKEGR